MSGGLESGSSEKPKRRPFVLHPGPEVAKRSAEIAQENKHSAGEVERLTEEITPVMERGSKHAEHVARAHALRDQAVQNQAKTVGVQNDHPSKLPRFPQKLDDRGHLRPGTSTDTLRPLASKVVETIRRFKGWLYPPPLRTMISYALEGDMKEIEWVIRNNRRLLGTIRWYENPKRTLSNAQNDIVGMRQYLEEAIAAESAKGDTASSERLARAATVREVIEQANADIEQIRLERGH